MVEKLVLKLALIFAFLLILNSLILLIPAFLFFLHWLFHHFQFLHNLRYPQPYISVHQILMDKFYNLRVGYHKSNILLFLCYTLDRKCLFLLLLHFLLFLFSVRSHKGFCLFGTLLNLLFRMEF